MQKLFNNVHRDGQKIFSYVTHVANIEGENLVLKGKYSLTTSKQMGKVAQLLGLTIISSDERPDFYQFHFGVEVIKANEFK
jgi:hypothetical protein